MDWKPVWVPSGVHTRQRPLRSAGYSKGSGEFQKMSVRIALVDSPLAGNLRELYSVFTGMSAVQKTK